MKRLIVTVVGMALSGSVMAAQGGDADKGKTTYGERACATCHKTTKDDATGGQMATVLADTVGKLSDADIKSWLTDAEQMEAKLPQKPPMPMSAFLKTLKPALTKEEVANLIAYLRTLPPAKQDLHSRP